MTAQKDLYEVLEVSRDVNEDEIKKAFRQKARRYHPDNKETGNEELFKEINQAYEILSDPKKRAVYDQYGMSGFQGGYGGSQFDFGFTDLSDIFSEFFGAGQRPRKSTGPERGADLRYDLSIDFLESIHGCTKQITISSLEECQPCKGSGAKPGSKLKICQICSGTGEIRKITESFFGHVTQIATCPTCRGDGKIVEEPCQECSGKGQKKVKKNIDIKVPCGVDDGARLRWGGKGESGRRSGPPGDLYVILNVKEHETFSREEQNIIISTKISFSLAALGGTIKVPSTEGEKSLTIPSGIQSGTILKIPGLGVPKLNNLARRGDQLVEVIIETPAKLTAEEKILFEKLSEIENQKHEKEQKKKGWF